jgi:hypothetical protein
MDWTAVYAKVASHPDSPSWLRSKKSSRTAWRRTSAGEADLRQQSAPLRPVLSNRDQMSYSACQVGPGWCQSSNKAYIPKEAILTRALGLVRSVLPHGRGHQPQRYHRRMYTRSLVIALCTCGNHNIHPEERYHEDRQTITCPFWSTHKWTHSNAQCLSMILTDDLAPSISPIFLPHASQD